MAPLTYLGTTCLWYSTHQDRHPNSRINQIVFAIMPSERRLLWVNASLPIFPLCWTSVTFSPRCCMARSARTLSMGYYTTCMNMKYSWLHSLLFLLAKPDFEDVKLEGTVKYPSYVWGVTADQLARYPEYSAGPMQLGVPNVMPVSADLFWCGRVPDTRRQLSGDACSSGSCFDRGITKITSAR